MIFVASTVRNLNRMTADFYNKNSNCIFLHTIKSNLYVQFKIDGNSYLIWPLIRDSHKSLSVNNNLYSYIHILIMNKCISYIFHLIILTIIIIYLIRNFKLPDVYTDADTRSTPMAFKKIISSRKLIHVQCQHCLPTYEMQLIQKQRNKKINNQYVQVFGYGPSSTMFHLPTFDVNTSIQENKYYKKFTPKWYFESFSDYITNTTYGKVNSFIWLDNDSSKIFDTQELHDRQRQKKDFFIKHLNFNPKLKITFRPHPVWKSENELLIFNDLAAINPRFSIDGGKEDIKLGCSLHELVLVTYSTSAFDAILTSKPVVFISLKNDQLPEKWSQHLNLPHFPINCDPKLMFSELMRKRKYYTQQFDKAFKMFFDNNN